MSSLSLLQHYSYHHYYCYTATTNATTTNYQLLLEQIITRNQADTKKRASDQISRTFYLQKHCCVKLWKIALWKQGRNSPSVFDSCRQSTGYLVKNANVRKCSIQSINQQKKRWVKAKFIIC